MTTTATPATPQPSSLDTALEKIDQLLSSPTLGVQQMTAEQFQAHTAAELEKALGEATNGKAEVSKMRLEHLKAQITTAKAVYDSGATLAPITMFQDPWQTKPGESASKGEATVPQSAITPTGDSNVQFKDDVVFVQTEKGRELSPLMKGLIVIAKASDKSPARQKLSKAEGGAEIIQKAGEAQSILANIATMFGIAVEGPADLLDYEFKWDVSDTISALQSAAKLEGVMQQMSGMLAAAAAAKGAGEQAAAEGVNKSANQPPAPPPAPAEGPWPTDMASAVFDEKTGLMKCAGDQEEGKSLYWGRDSEQAPTT